MNLARFNTHDQLSDTSTEPEHSQTFDSNPKSQENCTNSKHKRSLCRNFTEKGYCPYGSKCQFAHGLDELKCNKTQNNLYKTKICYSFLKKGFCMYQLRCNFIHKNDEDQMLSKKKKALQNYRDLFYQSRTDNGSRLIKLLTNSQ